MDKYKRRIDDISNKRNKYQEKLTKSKLELTNIENEKNAVRLSIGKTIEETNKCQNALDEINEIETRIANANKTFKKKAIFHLIVGTLITLCVGISAYAAGTTLLKSIIVAFITSFLTSGSTILQEKLETNLKIKQDKKYLKENPKYILEAKLESSLAEKKKADNYLKKLKRKSKALKTDIAGLEHIISELTNYLASMIEAREIALKHVAGLDIDDFYYKDSRVTEINKLERKLQNDITKK